MDSGEPRQQDDVLSDFGHDDCLCNRQFVLRRTGKMKKPVCNFNCFECPHPDCICDDFSRKEYVTDAEINRIAGMTRSKTGLRKKEYLRKYYSERKEYAKAYQKSYYEKNKERIREKARERYRKNRDRYIASVRAYQESNKEKFNAYKKEYSKKYKRRKREERENEKRQRIDTRE
nr:MAG TPA: hypothetical protein [Caudoviricetes sp.]